MFDYKIILDDGTEVMANLNMNTWESETEPDDSVFKDNTKNISYITPDGETIQLGECKFVKGIQFEGGWRFFLNHISEEEKRKNEELKLKADVDFIAMELGVDLDD